MEGFNAEKTTALGIRDLALVGREKEKKSGWEKQNWEAAQESKNPGQARVSPTAPSPVGRDLSALP